ncbi:MAG TPA: hypothetical protein VHF47_07870 [Acidimicrobiales bacterium]|nr:hypothetical protein [Acidimicrobiales bacterium]
MSLRQVRILCAALAAIVVFDALWVRAPGLALFAVPFLVGARRARRGTTLGMAALMAFAVLYVVVGVNYIVANGIDVNPGDFAFAFVGTPVAVLLAVRAASSMKRPVAT